MNVTGMSREELEREARRIGVIAPERLGRHALERRIREHHASPLRRARRAFRGLVGLAKAIAGAPPSLPSTPPSGATPNPTATPTPTPTGTPNADAETRAPTPKAETREPNADAETRTPTPNADAETRTPTPNADAETRAPTPKADAETRAPTSKADSDLPGEPIPTRTMARLLADQGHARRALAIYKKLLRESPNDADLREEVDRLESSARSRGTKATSGTGDADDDESEGVEVVALPVGRARVLIAWSVAPALAAAEALLDDPADLEARVVVVRADANGAIRREVRERPAEPAGEWVVPVYAGARVTAAVGLNQGGRFVSVAHAPVVIA